MPVTEDALVLFEVLSRSNTKADQAWRRKVYASVPNCQHYVTVSLKAVEVDAYDRDSRWKRRTFTSLAMRWPCRRSATLLEASAPSQALTSSRPARARPLDTARRHLSLDALSLAERSRTKMNLDNLKTTAGLDVRGKRVLVRADLNVPVKDGKVTDATRLERLVPGLQDLARRGAKVIVISHFGRPKGGPTPEFSLKPVADKLGELLGAPVAFAADCIGEPAEKARRRRCRPGDFAVLENLRFHKGEEKNDPAFASALAKLGDIFVSDAFSTAHRAHASTEAITRLLPSYAGPLMMEEINALRQRAGQARAADGRRRRRRQGLDARFRCSTNLVAKVDKLIIGGGMANTFLLAQGVEIGKSLAEPDFAETALRDHARRQGSAAARSCCRTMSSWRPKFEAGAASAVVTGPRDARRSDDPRRRAEDCRALHRCARPLPARCSGTARSAPSRSPRSARAPSSSRARRRRLTKAGKLVSVAGGGDTVAALNAAGVTDEFTYVSTAGGAFLEWLEGRELPGIAALARARRLG